MRIAFLSHEFPPDTGGGGIGTYLDQVCGRLACDGHEVSVFCGAAGTSGTHRRPDGVLVHRVAGDAGAGFRAALVPVFAALHAVLPFDVMETTDFDAPALDLKRAFPDLPCVIKLHTPRFVVDELHHREPTRAQRWRIRLGALRRGRWPDRAVPVREQPAARAELAALAEADEIAAPSPAIAAAAAAWAPAAAGKISIFSYPYEPPTALLDIPAGSATNRVTFVGRLEERKGVIDLADAVPAVLARHPTARFRFVGQAMTSPVPGEDMGAFLKRRLGAAATHVEFTGPVPPAELPRLLADTAVLVAPSHWESFGLVCCEGLAAARAVVGSTAGGMPEILDQGRCGRLVPPHDPARLAAALTALLHNPAERQELGETGRARILRDFAWSRILPAQLASYQRARERCARTAVLPASQP